MYNRKKAHLIDYKYNQLVEFLNEKCNINSNIITSQSVQSSYYGDYDQYEDEKNKAIRNELALWRAVLWQEIADAKTLSKKEEAQKAKVDAIKFFKSNNTRKHLINLCKLCGYNYKHILKYLDIK
ncbi:MAG: hypothetical protein RL208_316 [Pseudomonadota bacterium]|jgi:hypothetical protein